eukprot:3907968-Rhodomonas_salina.2
MHTAPLPCLLLTVLPPSPLPLSLSFPSLPFPSLPSLPFPSLPTLPFPSLPSLPFPSFPPSSRPPPSCSLRNWFGVYSLAALSTVPAAFAVDEEAGGEGEPKVEVVVDATGVTVGGEKVAFRWRCSRGVGCDGSRVV